MASVTAKPQKTPKVSDRARKSNKPAPPVEDVLKRHFKSLVSQIDGGHFKNAIKTTNKSNVSNTNMRSYANFESF